jgi:TIR domain
MRKIAISYRRSDSSAIAGRIFDRLAAHFGKPSVFMDIDNIPFGIDFRTHIQDALLRTDVLLAVIGPKWTGPDAGGTARIRQESDPVRVEVETALERRVPVIPVLVDGAKMPASTELPESFRNFAFLNAAEVATGRDFHTHMDRLIDAIDQTVGAGASVGAKSSTSEKNPALVADAFGAPPKSWPGDLLRYLAVPLVLLLVVHHVIVNSLDLNTEYLRIATWSVSFGFGFAFFWRSGRGAGPGISFALALGVLAVAGMTISEGLNSGEPILPQTRFEWRDNIEYAVGIALCFIAGHALARALRAAISRNVRKL